LDGSQGGERSERKSCEFDELIAVAALGSKALKKDVKALRGAIGTGLGGASAGSPPIHDGMSATGLLPLVAHPAIRLAMTKSSMRLGLIVSAPSQVARRVL
jgi:hypothetical protein